MRIIMDSTIISLKVSKKRTRQNRHKCPICPKLFPDRRSLADHIFLHTNERPFKCITCGKSFKTKSCLETHQRIHSGENPYSCSKCELKFNCKAGLRSHMRYRHDKNLHPKNIECLVCHRTFWTQSELSLHSKTHSDVKEFACVFCDYRCRYLRNLLSHISYRHIKEKPYNCPECSSSYSNAGCLKYHIARAHRQEEWKKNKCSVCQKEYATKGELTRHRKSHLGDKTFSCSICDKKFSAKHKLADHLKVHTKPHSCPVCEKRFGSKTSAKLHLLRHTGEKPFGCKECPARFLSKMQVGIHVKEHHRKEHPFPCDICGRHFARAWTRNRHLSTHLNEKPSACGFCDRRYAGPGLKVHLKYHNIATDSRCPACPKRFLWKVEMLKHLLKVHVGSNNNLLECLFCKEVSKTVKQLEHHVNRHTGERPHFCTVCHKSFIIESNLKNHMSFVHKIG